MMMTGSPGECVSSSSPTLVSSTSLTPPPSSSSFGEDGKVGYSSSVRQIMLNQYTPWVMSTYGDSAKTKTITARKYARIVDLLKANDKEMNGGEPSGSEASKFKLWVKTKGFHLGPPASNEGRPFDENDTETLYIPTGTDKASDGKVHFVYKKVAMVEEFFDIIYSVHVESALDTQLRGRAGKHCGQKRTYRAVADQFAFIPREAISKFLLYCVDCQRKNSSDSRRLTSGPKKLPQKAVDESATVEESSAEGRGNLSPAAAVFSQAVVATMRSLATSPLIQAHPSLLATHAAALIRNPVVGNGDGKPKGSNSDPPTSEMDLSLPITSTYLRRMRALGLAAGLELQKERSLDVKLSEEDFKIEEEGEINEEEEEASPERFDRSRNVYGSIPINSGQRMSQLSTLLSQNGSAMNLASSGLQHQEQTVIEPVVPDDASSNGAKEDEDEEDDDDMNDEKIEGIICGDPEKLKAFNMFVRLFVDENLDRHVPISKQPKEKIQAIIDSCTRQFPEHACRARKRIRTYLKSCRRTKRTREQAGLDPANTRPTPPHLTSVQAEQLLARACENEAENAKRMRMGMEPISQPMPVYSSNNESPIDVVSTVNVTTNTTASKPDQQLAATLLAATQQPVNAKSPPVIGSMFTTMNGATTATTTSNTAMYRQPFPQGTAVFPTLITNNPPPPPPPPVLNLQNQPTVVAATTTTTPLHQQQQQNGPVESIKKTPLLNHKLNSTEMAAVRQLITGYRESAAFLLRSADELEQLLQIQPKL